MPKSLTSKHTCEAEGCKVLTGFRRDGTPAKYGKSCGHQAESRARMREIFAAGAAERAARDQVFETITHQAMEIGREAAEAAGPLSGAVSKTIVFKANRKFSNYLVRTAQGVETPQGVVITFPAVSGSKEQAEAVFGFLRPLTASGEVLEGQSLSLR